MGQRVKGKASLNEWGGITQTMGRPGMTPLMDRHTQYEPQKINEDFLKIRNVHGTNEFASLM
jgi:hypothetical protein